MMLERGRYGELSNIKTRQWWWLMGGGGLNTNYFERSRSELLQFIFYICSYPGVWAGLGWTQVEDLTLQVKNVLIFICLCDFTSQN